MDKRFAVANITEALTTRSFPTITVWNRLEGRPRTENFTRALKAEVRDALWMLTKQWQMGEFRGDDAGTPVFTKVHLTTTRLTKYRADDHTTEVFEDNVPLEATVERRPIAFSLGGENIALDIRLLMGRQWIKMVTKIGNYAQAFTEKYPIREPDPTTKEDAPLCAHQEVWQTFAAASTRLMDGALLYFYLKGDPAHKASDDVAVLDIDKDDIDKLAPKFIAWFEKLYYQPTVQDAWEPSQLEYRFACSAPETTGESVLLADEYYHGHLDWYNFDLDPQSKGLGDAMGTAPPDPRGKQTQTLIPTQVVFDGMPNTRWWTFEDRKTNFGDIKPDTTELAKLLLIEFGLVYANDWFLIPYTLPVGSLAKIKGMAVTNVFGERTWIEPAGSGPDKVWGRWSMFTLNTKGVAGKVAADTSMLLLPTVPKAQEGRPLETVVLIRDEMANMVWGIEKTVLLASGDSKQGGEAATETLNYYKKLLAENPGPAPGAPPLIKNEALIRYQVMNSVPEHWIPFIPVHVEDDNRETQLQRAAMPRIIEGDPNKPEKVRPRTILLREGLDRAVATAYFLHEEEVPRAGVQVKQSFQRARWRNGDVFVWLGVRKQTGRGEGSSGLAFDRLVDIKTPS
jgi:hypothetical protein